MADLIRPRYVKLQITLSFMLVSILFQNCTHNYFKKYFAKKYTFLFFMPT